VLDGFSTPIYSNSTSTIALKAVPEENYKITQGAVETGLKSIT
jgi:hypothetical protein